MDIRVAKMYTTISLEKTETDFYFVKSKFLRSHPIKIKFGNIQYTPYQVMRRNRHFFIREIRANNMNFVSSLTVTQADIETLQVPPGTTTVQFLSIFPLIYLKYWENLLK